ncbi:MAG: thioesterase [Betaproteobacteria bacterium]|nr:thioesterase [Betaproteobacteria bacterium]
MSDTWLQSFSPNPQASVRLFCFAHAGGGAAAYRLWHRGLPGQVEVCAIQLPGRANRFREPALRSIPAIVEGLLPSVLPQLDRPYAFFGHSMGSMIAFALAHELVQRGAPVPAHLFMSGRRGPRVPDTEPPLHALSDADFVSELLRRYGGIPAEVLAEPELMDLLLPSLRADIHALETYRPHGRSPLPCPVTAYGGAEDSLNPPEHLDAWRGETGAAFRARTFAGGHFYLEAKRDELLADIAETLRAMPVAPLASEAGA